MEKAAVTVTGASSVRVHTRCSYTTSSEETLEASTTQKIENTRETITEDIPQDDATRQEGLPTPIKVEKLAEMLAGYSDSNYILQGFADGFKVGHLGDSHSIVSKNSM